MFTHKKILYSPLFILSMLIAGCATTYVPDNWLPETDEVPQSTNGSWITVETREVNYQNDEKWMQYSGEFIAIDDANIYLLYDSSYVIPKDNIVNSIIEIDQKNTGAYGAWVALGSISTLSNGFYLIFTFPLWLIAGIPVASGESYRDRYEAELPDEIYWNNVNKFSRFPQGVKNINLIELQPILKKVE
jgi:hypothetical protein